MPDVQQQRPRSRTGVPIGPRVKEVLRVMHRVRRPVLLEGPTGIGKSEIVQQAAEELGVEFVSLDLSLLEPPDLVGLPVTADGRTAYAPPQILPSDGGGILMLEELNRAERYIQQPALQLLTARRLHQYTLPEGWSVCAAINPECEGYHVTPLDPALRARFLNLLVRADRQAWLEWAEGRGVHPAVLRLAQAHDDFLDDVPPRTWAYASDVLHGLTPAEREDEVLLRVLLGGYLPAPLVGLLVRAVAELDRADGVDVFTLLATLHTDAALQERVAGYGRNGSTDRLYQIGRQVHSVLAGPELDGLIARGEFSLDAFECLLPLLPGDTAEQLQEALAAGGRAGSLIDVTPADVLRSYRNSAAAHRVDGWVRDSNLRHRALVLGAEVRRHLEREADLAALRRSRAALADLGHFVSRLPEPAAGQLMTACRKLELDLVLPTATGGRRK